MIHIHPTCPKCHKPGNLNGLSYDAVYVYLSAMCVGCREQYTQKVLVEQILRLFRPMTQGKQVCSIAE